MSTPVAPAKFVHPDDIKVRYDGDIAEDSPLLDIPDGLFQQRIIDVESRLIGLVRSLAVPVDQIDEDRLRAVQALVADKVLELYRNPDGAMQVSQQMETLTVTRQLRGNTSSQAVWFSEQELDTVRLRKSRPRFGTIPVRPGLRPLCP